MHIPWKALLTGFVVLAAANAAHAVSIQDWLNDAVISSKPEDGDKVRSAGVVLSISTEALRSLWVGLITRSECIEDNFFGKDAPGADALYSHMFGAKNKNSSVEGYIMRAIEIYCPSGATQGPATRHRMKAGTFVEDFYEKVVPDNYDKITVLNMALVTQAEIIKSAGDEVRERCVDGLTVKITNERPNIPMPFKTDIMQELSKAILESKREHSDATFIVEAILLKAIIKNCGDYSK
jgi:hypothetical protein